MAQYDFDMGAKVEYGNASFVDEHAISLDGKRHSAKHWVIATGSSAALPPIDGLKETPKKRSSFFQPQGESLPRLKAPA
jgi:pyruvate/2-oxoglutarate dehydrogenase complex dihydrolipoamide dehydrogenase (E3) component